MSLLEIGAQLRYQVIDDSSFAFLVNAAQSPTQSVLSERIEVTPDVPMTLVPQAGGSQQLIRLSTTPGDLQLTYRSTVAIEPATACATPPREVPFAVIPAEVLPYLNPSRYCESDKLGDFAWRHFGAVEPGYGRVQEISSWVGASILYVPGLTDTSSSAADVLLHRAGVCRDFAHVAIALCRAIGIPARYVSGYGLALEPQDFHGFFEAYLGDTWHLFDPTGMTMPDGLVRIGFGRDAADTPFATLVGRADLVDKVITVEVA